MRVVVNGASGFLGQNLIRELNLHQDIDVIAVSSQVSGLKKALAHIERIHVIEKDSFPDTEIDFFINCAFPRTYDGASMASGLKYVADQMEYYSKTNAKGIINISSQSVYNPNRFSPATEEAPLFLSNSYAVGKYAAELLTNMICRQIPHTNIRMASLIGPGFNQRITNVFAGLVINGEDIHLKAGSQLYGFLDVRDASSALVSMLESEPKRWREVYNLGRYGGFTLGQIANEVVSVGDSLGYNKSRIITEESDIHNNSTVESKLFREEFHWNPSLSFRETIESIFMDLIENNK